MPENAVFDRCKGALSEMLTIGQASMVMSRSLVVLDVLRTACLLLLDRMPLQWGVWCGSTTIAGLVQSPSEFPKHTSVKNYSVSRHTHLAEGCATTRGFSKSWVR